MSRDRAEDHSSHCHLELYNRPSTKTTHSRNGISDNDVFNLRPMKPDRAGGRTGGGGGGGGEGGGGGQIGTDRIE